MNNSADRVPSNIPIQTESGLRLSALNPKYLHTNSTSHTWPFSAIAELVDNAYDPDVKASQLRIDLKNYKVRDRLHLSLIFADNGSAMTADKLYKMLSFGFCEKVTVRGHMPVGHYGNGFKSGSMRLGKDALVFTKHTKTQSLGFLSQTYLSAVSAETIIVPIVTWDRITGKIIDESEERMSLPAILKYSVITSLPDIMKEFSCIEKTGTRIVISNLRCSKSKQSEFDFDSVSDDIGIPDDAHDSEESKYKREERQQHIPASDYSLRAYLSILYLKPRMQIFLRGSKVKTVVIKKSLSRTELDVYKPINNKAVKIVFGFSENINHYGIMMYHRNRLIKPYVRVGCQLKANNMGVGVVGVIECDSLQPTHNKQDFDYTPLFRSTMNALGQKLNEYWNEKCSNTTANVTVNEINEQRRPPDETWVQCDKTNCLKWRRLPDYIATDTLPDKWYCHMHPSSNWNSCVIPEEEEEPVDNVKPYEKKLKKIERELRQKEADKIKTNQFSVEIERRRREKAEFEKQQQQKEFENLKAEMARLKKGNFHIERMEHLNAQLLFPPADPNSQMRNRNNSFTNVRSQNDSGPSFPQITNVTHVPRTVVVQPITPLLRQAATHRTPLSRQAPTKYNTPLSQQAPAKHIPPSRNPNLSLVDLLQSKDPLNLPVDSTVEEEYIDFPVSVAIKQENEKKPNIQRLQSTVDSTDTDRGSKKRPINLDSSDEEDDFDDGHANKAVKLENNIPANNELSNSVTLSKSTCNDTTVSNEPITNSVTLSNSTCNDTTVSNSVAMSTSSDSTSEASGSSSDNMSVSRTNKPEKRKKMNDCDRDSSNLKERMFKIHAHELESIDADIIEDLKKQCISTLGVLLAKRSQALRNLRQKAFKLIQTIVSDDIKFPDVSKQSIDDESVEELLDTVININMVPDSDNEVEN